LPQAQFATTRWSIVVNAGRAGSRASSAQDALARLCRTYWFPLYAHVRRRGFSAHDAEDLTQEFFARLLARQTIAHADPSRGRFRAFILTALNHFLADEWDRARTLKRGGTHERVSLDLADAEERFAQVADPAASPDRMFDREWALAVLRTVLAQLESEYAAAGKADVFGALKPTLTGSRESQPYAELAAQLDRNEGAVKVAVHRLRQRYRALLQAEIADTVASNGDAQAEMRELLQALSW
jgi:RNA polymerase sigma-70 factor (ECF subfamily)